MGFHLGALEYHKILEQLSARCVQQHTKEDALALLPSGELQEARRAQAHTEAAYALAVRRGAPKLRAVRDVTEALLRAERGGALTLSELLSVAHVLAVMRELRDYRGGERNLPSALDGYFEVLYENRELERTLIENIISPDDLADTASDELYALRRKIIRLGEGIRDRLEMMIRSPEYVKYLQEPIVTVRDGRFVLPVRAEFKAQVPGLLHDTSGSGATLFIEPLLVVEANNEIGILRAAERAEIEKIISQYSAEVAGVVIPLREGLQSLWHLDLCFAKAALAIEWGAFPPQLTDDNRVFLKAARHPLLPRDSAVSNDIRIGEGYRLLIITGPNTGGKTVALKTLGLLSLLAQIGLFLPCAEGSSVSVFRSIMADIGDEQSIEQSLSTFSGHMKNIVGILGGASRDSLVLVDELGAGTDPAEGAALAIAILERLAATGGLVAATTHYAELKAYALETPYAENASCEFDVDTLRPTYRLIIGTPGRSNAFAISARLGLPGDVIREAQARLSQDDRRFDNVVQKLEETRIRLEGEIREAEGEKTRAVRMRDEAEAKLRDVEGRIEREIEGARERARDLLREVKGQSEALLREIDDIRKDKESGGLSERGAAARQLLRREIAKLEESADPVVTADLEHYTLPRPLQKGDEVTIYSLNRRGVVVEAGADFALVQAGVLKARIALSDLRLVIPPDNKEKGARHRRAPAAPAPRGGAKTNVSRAERDARTEVDIRGLDSEEGIYAMEQFLDNALLMGFENVTVIHGVGTGVLRTAVRQRLRKLKQVKSFRPGSYGEGENGVTIVELK